MIKMQNTKGQVCITNDVFTGLVGDTATKCFGVKGMAMRSVSDGLVHLLKKESMGKGVYVRYNEDSSVAIELHIIVEQGINIPVLCRSIMKEVQYKVETLTGVSVRSVDVFVDSINIG